METSHKYTYIRNIVCNDVEINNNKNNINNNSHVYICIQLEFLLFIFEKFNYIRTLVESHNLEIMKTL
jgi:hypothetical protein